MIKQYMLIPIELCKFALSRRKTKQAALWAFLKSCTSGHFLLNKKLKSNSCEILGFKSQKTFKKHFDWLIKNKWITVNSKTGSHRLISINQLSRKYHFISSLAAKLYFEDIGCIEGFFAAAVITYCSRIAKKSRRKGQSEYKESHKLNGVPFSTYNSSKYCPYSCVPITYLAKFFGVPKSTAKRIRQKAINTGLIEISHVLHPTIYSTKNYKFLKSVGREETEMFKRKKNHKKIHEQMPDKIISHIELKTKINCNRQKMAP